MNTPYTTIDIPLNQPAAEEDIRSVADALGDATSSRAPVRSLRRLIYWAEQQLRVSLTTIDNERRIAA